MPHPHAALPLLQPFHLLAKPAGAACNLGCRYCFFLSKQNLYPERESPLMTDSVLETHIAQLMAASPGPQVEVAWQGGEPMLRGLDFYRRAMDLVRRHRQPRHREILHTMQTNGTLVDDAWAAFFKANDFLVGLSIDGPRAMHDAYRLDKHGRGSFDDVIRGWNCLRRHEVDVNILCTIHAANADHPLEVYRFFRDELGAQYIQLIPVVERGRPLYTQEVGCVTGRSVKPEQFGRFLCGIFDEWVQHDVGKVFVTTFDVALGSWLGEHNACVAAPTCGTALAMEHNGDVYSCDHFVEPRYLLGNIRHTPLAALVASEKQRRFGWAKFDTLPGYCKECPVLFACYGECPRNRFVRTPEGEEGLNYLCAGYKAFFSHIDAPMRVMARLIRDGGYADEIMQVKAAT